MRTVLVLLIAAASLPAAEEFANKARLSRASVRRQPRRNYALPEGRTAAEKPAARRGSVARLNVLFFDVDGDGRFGEVGVDGWMLQDMNYVLPMEPTAVLEVSSIRWEVDPGGAFVHYDSVPVPVEGAHRKTFRQFNYWRLINGLPPVAADERLSAACTKHCAYMERHGLVHVEEEGKPGYTAEGAEAGRRSCISEEGPGMSVLMFYSTFYHRLPLIHPDTRAVGIGASGRHSAVDGLSLRSHRAWRYPVIVPAPGSALQPTHFAHESPRPHPEGLTPGLPITLTFDRGAVTGAAASLRLKSAKGPEIPILVSSPERPANSRRPDNRMSILVLPKQPLPPGKVLWIRVTYELDGEARRHEWRFRTGRPRPVPRLR